MGVVLFIVGFILFIGLVCWLLPGAQGREEGRESPRLQDERRGAQRGGAEGREGSLGLKW